ncbi:uncharacterized protein LOC103318074 [Nasonia vitripennis]|uniref:Uncharacterized protein n=1 Tax=Nasonia vitripennis TaxID=7425 RepID=A0A7M7QDC2_NASVI|nr:uncharacterized protein LOC103318074 [Nasonia vitripennis]
MRKDPYHRLKGGPHPHPHYHLKGWLYPVPLLPLPLRFSCAKLMSLSVPMRQQYYELREAVSKGYMTRMEAIDFLEYQLPALYYNYDYQRMIATQALEILQECAAEKMNCWMHSLIELVIQIGEFCDPGLEFTGDREILDTLIRVSKYLKPLDSGFTPTYE